MWRWFWNNQESSGKCRPRARTMSYPSLLMTKNVCLGELPHLNKPGHSVGNLWSSSDSESSPKNEEGPPGPSCSRGHSDSRCDCLVAATIPAYSPEGRPLSRRTQRADQNMWLVCPPPFRGHGLCEPRNKAADPLCPGGAA